MTVREGHTLTAESLRSHLAAALPRDAVPERLSILETILLDSLSVMSVVYFIEQEAGIDIPAEDVTIENFESLSAIAAYVRRRRG